MTPLAELIAYYKAREIEYAEERDRSGKMPTEADQKRCAELWEKWRRIARDTASWLETIERRQP